MLNQIFENKTPFVYNYFSNLLNLVFENKRKFPQALIFEGNDTKTQYLFALELARILNCQKNKEQDCDCINCKWIKTHSHPAINNVSQIHFKGEGDESKTVISVKQAREIEKNLSFSSDYYRFFIFFSSSEVEDMETLDDFKSLGYSDEINYSIEPLEYNTFHPTTPNALLKSIEEPPENTVFIFLTKSKEDILPTIVSRCLTFKLNGIKESIGYQDCLNLFSAYLNLDYTKALNLSDEFQKYIKENNKSCEILLNKFLEYLKDLIKQNISNFSLVQKIQNDIKIINHAIKQTRANISDKVILEAMLLRITRGY